MGESIRIEVLPLPAVSGEELLARWASYSAPAPAVPEGCDGTQWCGCPSCREVIPGEHGPEEESAPLMIDGTTPLEPCYCGDPECFWCGSSTTLYDAPLSAAQVRMMFEATDRARALEDEARQKAETTARLKAAYAKDGCFCGDPACPECGPAYTEGDPDDFWPLDPTLDDYHY